MEYFFVGFFQLAGIAFHVIQKIIALGGKYPTSKKKEILTIFFNEDWDTLCGSAVVLLVDIVTHIAVNYYSPETMNTSFAFPWLWGLTLSARAISFFLALFLGYAGQRVIYAVFGGTERKIINTIEEKFK